MISSLLENNNLVSQVDVMRDWFPSPVKWLFIRFESGPDYKNILHNSGGFFGYKDIY